MVTVRPNGFIQPSIPTRAAKPPSGFDAVRLFTRRGHDWTDRYAAIAKAAAKLRARSFIDGKAAVCGPNGVAIFDALHHRARKAKRARLLARNPAGIAFNEHTNDDGAAVFRHACKMGLEGIVS
jgi:bifunctional non-homologous end joining protein LigD